MKRVFLALFGLFAIAFISVNTSADELPDEYLPLRILLGQWTGVVDVEVESQNGLEKFRYKKKSSTHFDHKQDAVIMIDVEQDIWRKVEVTTTAIIRWDVVSNRFKSMVSGADGSVRLFVTTHENEVLHYRQLDGVPGTKFHCQVSAGEKGQIIESGFSSFPEPNQASVKWRIVYSPQVAD